MQISPAMCMARFTTSVASSCVLSTSARAAARAYEPPEPMARMPSSGSISSPVPDTMKPLSLSATMSSASSRRSTRSLRQSLASSTAARDKLPGYRSSFSSNLSNNVIASATAPAKPATIFPPRMSRTFCAWDFITVSPTVTWPSPPIATLPLRRTARTVVARTRGNEPEFRSDMSGNLTRASAESPAIGDGLPEVVTVAQRPEQKQHRAGYDGDDRVAPRVAPDERRSHADDAEADRRFPAPAALDARPPTSFALDDDLVGRPGVEHQRQADETHQDADDDRNQFETHVTSVVPLRSRVCLLVDLLEPLDAGVRVDLGRRDR